MPNLRAAALALIAASPALAGPHPRPTNDFGHEFVRIGKPGNRHALPSERVDNSDLLPNLGGVNRRYRISKYETTATQWIEFVNAYEPYWVAAGGWRGDSAFISEAILATNNNPANGPPGYFIRPGSENTAVTMSWYNAARYCNWLHNDKATEQWAFESGAYDTSTFGGVPGVGYSDQWEHSPDAKFWLPTLDEWTKAAYYDPNRYGEGQDGYWSNAGMQNDPLRSGPPGVGQTSAGQGFPPGYNQHINVGAYPDTLSPWGLLDTSGGVSEWTETLKNAFLNPQGALNNPSRIIRGSEMFNTLEEDIIDPFPINGSGPWFGTAGFRLASAIPAPTAYMSLVGAMICADRRRRRASVCR